jgi:hypothetical protein
MNRDDIIRMARLSVIDLYGPMPDEKMYDVFIERCAKFAHLVAASEREACAEICDEQMEIREINTAMAVAAGNCADLIRARGE